MTGLFSRIYRLRPSRPRHPLLRVGFALIGVVLLALLLVGGVVVGLGMLAFGAARRLLRGRKAAAIPGQILEAEYRVVTPRVLPHNR